MLHKLNFSNLQRCAPSREAATTIFSVFLAKNFCEFKDEMNEVIETGNIVVFHRILNISNHQRDFLNNF